MELREKIADAARKLDYDYPLADELADAILAIPEIAEALGRSYKGMVIVEDASLGPGEFKLVPPLTHTPPKNT